MYLCFAVPPALRLPGAREGLQWSPVSPVRARRASAAARTRVRSGRGAPHACTAGPTTVDVSLSDDVADDPMACSLAPALEADASALLDAALHGDEAELSLLLCSDAYISQLNERWRRVDKATDVLSFPQGDGAVLGDIVISVETAARQAEERCHPLAAELRILLVHGLLHLLGYDHETCSEDLEEMAEAEGRLMTDLGWQGVGLIGATAGASLHEES